MGHRLCIQDLVPNLGADKQQQYSIRRKVVSGSRRKDINQRKSTLFTLGVVRHREIECRFLQLYRWATATGEVHSRGAGTRRQGRSELWLGFCRFLHLYQGGNHRRCCGVYRQAGDDGAEHQASAWLQPRSTAVCLKVSALAAACVMWVQAMATSQLIKVDGRTSSMLVSYKYKDMTFQVNATKLFDRSISPPARMRSALYEGDRQYRRRRMKVRSEDDVLLTSQMMSFRPRALRVQENNLVSEPPPHLLHVWRSTGQRRSHAHSGCACRAFRYSILSSAHGSTGFETVVDVGPFWEINHEALAALTIL